MRSYVWADCTRDTLAGVLPSSVVVLPIGSTEQHGPHLPTRTDALIVGRIAAEAVSLAAPASPRPLVLAPTMPYGASDHHFPFGATLSLDSQTVTAVLVDLLRSVRTVGGERVLIVNGHGGNRGACHGAAQIASTRHELHVGYLDYWSVLADDRVPGPGHAGRFETAMIEHLAPDLVVTPAARPHPPEHAVVDDVALYSQSTWRAIDGYTDRPDLASAADGAAWFQAGATALAARLVEMAAAL